MYPYTKVLTLEQALKLRDKLSKQEIPEIKVFNSKFSASVPPKDGNPDWLRNWIIEIVYQQGYYLSTTALDYATYILGEVAPPEGWGYAAFDEPERYFGFPYMIAQERKWNKGYYPVLDFKWSNWYNYAFRLQDLARVEEVAETEKTATDWKAKYEAQAAEIAKYLEMGTENASLKIQVLEATKSADLKQDKIIALEEGISAADTYIRALLKKLSLLEQLKVADIEIEKAASNHYPF